MLVITNPLYDQSKRHALQSAVIDVQYYRWASEAQFFRYLDAFEVSNKVNKYETTTAWAYTQGTVFAYKMNELMREHEWSSLFEAYGHCVKALYSYCDKMQDLYGERKTLYRGFVGSWEQTLEEYKVGKSFTWASFTSVSESRNIAILFANGEYYHDGPGRPILFEISTLSRGAPLLTWSEYPYEDEILLQPFQGFEVVGLHRSSNMLVVQLRTVLLPKRQNCVPEHQVQYNHHSRAWAEPEIEMRAIEEQNPCLDFMKVLAMLILLFSFLAQNVR